MTISPGTGRLPPKGLGDVLEGGVVAELDVAVAAVKLFVEIGNVEFGGQALAEGNQALAE